MKLWIGLMTAAVLTVAPIWARWDNRAEAQDAEGRFAYVTPTPGSHRINVAVLNRGRAQVSGSVVPGVNRGLRIRVKDLAWSPNSQRLAVHAAERGRRTDLVFVYNADLDQEFARRTSGLAQELAETCRPVEATGQSNTLRVLRNNRLIPRGSTLKFRPATGELRSARFEGWMTNRRFVMRIVTNPTAFVEEPSGKVSKALAGKPLGQAVPVFGVYLRRDGAWRLHRCTTERPDVPPRPEARHPIKINASGKLRFRGEPLETPQGQGLPVRQQKALRVEGPY